MKVWSHAKSLFRNLSQMQQVESQLDEELQAMERALAGHLRAQSPFLRLLQHAGSADEDARDAAR